MKSIKKRETKKIRSSLKISTIEGSWWAVMYGTVETYFGAFFEYLKYSSYEISILMTFPIFFGAIFQNLANKLYNLFKSRKILLMTLKLVQSITIPIIFYIGYSSGSYYILLIFICFYFAIALAQMSPWTSWMGYLVPGRLRGRYFGTRSQIVRIFMLISSLIAGAILNAYNDTDPIVGFGIIFFVGVVANSGSIIYLKKQFEPPSTLFDEGNEKINLRDASYKKLRRFIVYDSLSEFALCISGPLIMIYWLRDLNFDYIELAVLINVSQVMGLFSLRYWGKKIDQLGSYLTIRLSSLAISIFPFFWIFIYYSPEQLKLPLSLLLASLASLMFSGRALAMDTRLYEHMNNKSMIRITSKRVFYRGLSTFAGGLFGGALTKTDLLNHFNLDLLNSQIHIVLIFSAFFRFAVWIKFLSKPKGSI
tara:strand:+ start:705 stop:1970 length:1266 start_codon:yes stop_codon:yes gene_type:complete